MEEYERLYTLGWGIQGPFLSDLRNEVQRLGYEYFQENLTNRFSPLQSFAIKIRGRDLKEFKEFMINRERIYGCEYACTLRES